MYVCKYIFNTNTITWYIIILCDMKKAKSSNEKQEKDKVSLNTLTCITRRYIIYLVIIDIVMNIILMTTLCLQ